MNIVETTDIYIQQGAELILPLGYSVDEVPAVFTGYTARMMARLTLDSASAIITLTTENGGITCSGNFVTLFMSHAATAALGTAFAADNQAVYDVETIAPDGTVTKPWHGAIQLIRSVTH